MKTIIIVALFALTICSLPDKRRPRKWDDFVKCLKESEIVAEKFDAILWGAELREVVEKAIALERAARIAYPILNFKNKDSGRLF